MRVRHKIPNVFSLSMMDVLCCALGCVILLWLLGAKQTEDETSELREQAASASAQSTQLLADSQNANAKLDQRLRHLLIDRDKAVALEARLAQRIADLERSRDLLTVDLRGEQARAGDLADRLKSSLARAATLEAEAKVGSVLLEAERKKSGALDKRGIAAEAALKSTRADLDTEKGRAIASQRQLSALNQEIDARKRELAGLTKVLTDADAARKKLEGVLALRDKALEAGKRDAKNRLDASAARERTLEEQLRARAVAIDAASRAYETLKVEATALRSTKDGRFAGIELTGKRVVFLVDMSGSMDLVDEKTPAPDKWPGVCTTVGRLMRSLSGLEKYQIICFSTKLFYPLGEEGKWLDFDRLKTPDEAVKVLRAVKPKGGTNMYIAVEAAFKLRTKQLDTVYLLSDGLPNYGEGITKEQQKELGEIERGTLLGKHIRKKLKEEWNKPIRTERVRINTIGFFYESPDLGAFL